MNAQSLLTFLYKNGVVVAIEDNQLLIEDVNKCLDITLIENIKLHKQAIIDLLNNFDKSLTLKVDKQEHTYPYQFECSFSQQRMLFMESLAGNKSFYNMPFAYKIVGLLNVSALNFSLIELVNKHDILRTTYSMEDDNYIQHIGDHVNTSSKKFSLKVLDISDTVDVDFYLKKKLSEEAQNIFSLQDDYPIRVSLIKISKEEFVLSLNIHHIAADGWSAHNIIDEINQGYKFHLNSLNNIRDVNHADSYQYIDYVKWQKEQQETGYYQEAKDYWLNRLADLPTLHNFPIDYIRPATLGVEGDNFQHTISESILADINRLAKEYKTTSFILIQSVFAAFLARYTDDSDIVFGTAVANRQPREFLNSVGLFVNTIVLRYALEKCNSLIDLVAQAKSNNKISIKYQGFPFDSLVNELKPQRSLAYNPLIQIMLVMQDDSTNLLDLSGVKVEPVAQSQPVSKFDFTLHVKLSGSELNFNWEYNKSLFKADTVKNIATQFQDFLKAVLLDPKKNINLIELSCFDEKIDKPNLNVFESPKCIHNVFENIAKQSPNAIALIDNKNKFTYKQLNESADIVATHLSRSCKITGQRVAVCMEKSVELVISMLAIFKIGGVYVPIDPSYPKDRITFMLNDSDVKILLSDNKTQLLLGERQIEVYIVESLIAQPLSSIHSPPCTPEQSAYVIYTSGSTGRPKGVEVSHQSLFYSLQANKLAMEFSDQDIMPTIGSQAFGVSLLEILLPLNSGAQVKIIRKPQVTDISELISNTNEVTVLHAVPSLMSQWLELIDTDDFKNSYPKLRLLLVGAEPVPETLIKTIKAWRPDVKLRVLYGMTESSVVSSSYEATMDTPSCYCIGRPHANTQFYILNKERKIQPKGVPGEMYVGGLSLATRYINQSQLTSDKFIESPFNQGERLYQTGDRVRCLNDGNYEFLGRVDNQVSLRGVRIELGEIESSAMVIPNVAQVITHVMEMKNGEKLLVLYFTVDQLQHDIPIITQEIKTKLANELPEHMMPSMIQYLAEFPLNANGKVDRKKLPLPSFKRKIVEPKNEIEQRLLLIWQDLLQIDILSVEDNFFEVGGHSLIATKLIVRVRSHFSVSLPLTSLFKSPTIRSCAELIESELKYQLSESLTAKHSTNENTMLVDEVII